MKDTNSSLAIAISNVSVSFPGCDVLKQVNLELPEGSVFALLGENGAGKTTLIRILTGFLRPSDGTCRVLGLDPTVDATEVRRRIGYVSDAPALYDWMRVGEIGWFASAFYAGDYIERYRQTIADYEVPEDRKIKHLSKGQRAKVALALALAHDPRLLILDEPTSGLDPLVRREFLESMIDRAATGRSVFLSSHQISEVERVADHVAILHEGSLRVAGSIHQLRESVQDVLLTLDDPLLSLRLIEPPMDVLSDRMEGRQRRMVVRCLAPQHSPTEWLEQLRKQPGVQNVVTRSASLEELFAACIRGQGQLERQSKGLRTPAPQVNDVA